MIQLGEVVEAGGSVGVVVAQLAAADCQHLLGQGDRFCIFALLAQLHGLVVKAFRLFQGRCVLGKDVGRGVG